MDVDSFITSYWEQLLFVGAIAVLITRLRVDVDTLKEKMKSAFDLINSIRDSLNK